MVNSVILIGNVGTDPFLKSIKDKGRMAMFKLVTETHNKGQAQPEWHELVCWGEVAEATEKILKKGDLVYIQGFLKTRSVDDSCGGKRFYTEIHVNKLTKLKTHVPNVSTTTPETTATH